MKFLYLLGKIFAYILLFFYAYIGIAAAFSLFELKMNRRQDISALSSLLKNEPGKVTKWVRLRPLSETESIVKILTPETGSLDAGVFFEMSRRHLLQKRTEESLFWSQFARYRLRYDLLRCGAPEAIESFDRLLGLFASPVLREFLEKNPDGVKKSLRQVLDFDEKYPASNDPSPICEMARKMEGSRAPMLPPETWESVRRNLRFVTEGALKEMDKSR